MAKVVYVCLRHPSVDRFDRLRKTLEQVSSRICPDNIEPRAPRIVEQFGLIAAVFSPSGAVRIAGASICAGHLTKDCAWDLPGNIAPEGAFALFRADLNIVEVLSDAVASRNVWYYFDDDILIAATTQRAIVAVLGSFEFHRAVVPWMLTNGSLGPLPSWDRRLGRLRPDSRLCLDRASWHLSIVAPEIAFACQQDPKMSHRDALLRCLTHTFASIQFDYRKWVLPLSGGYDSRGILCLLPQTAGLRTITWGVAASRRQAGNDALVAQQVAAALGVRHEFRQTDPTPEPPRRIFNRFVAAGEGCIDHISAYMDGFAIWRSLYEEGIEGVIRGDEGFGWTRVKSPADVLKSIGIALWSHYENLPTAESLGLPPHHLPADLERRSTESLDQWRDRLYHQYRVPTVLAALNDLKLHYVEVANPLLARPILDLVRSMPDRQRTEKRLFRTIVKDIGPNIGIARYPANAELPSLLKTPEVVSLLRDVLRSDSARCILPNAFLQLIGEKLVQGTGAKRSSGRSRWRRLVSRLVRAAAVGKSARRTPEAARIDFNVVAFRVYLVCRMHELLSEDARICDFSQMSQ